VAESSHCETRLKIHVRPQSFTHQRAREKALNSRTEPFNLPVVASCVATPIESVESFPRAASVHAVKQSIQSSKFTAVEKVVALVQQSALPRQPIRKNVESSGNVLRSDVNSQSVTAALEA
jgi:hypothetical protein